MKVADAVLGRSGLEVKVRGFGEVWPRTRSESSKRGFGEVWARSESSRRGFGRSKPGVKVADADFGRSGPARSESSRRGFGRSAQQHNCAAPHAATILLLVGLVMQGYIVSSLGFKVVVVHVAVGFRPRFPLQRNIF